MTQPTIQQQELDFWVKRCIALDNAREQRERLEEFAKQAGLIPVHPKLLEVGVLSPAEITPTCPMPMIRSGTVHFFIDVDKRLYFLLQLPDDEADYDEYERQLNRSGLAWHCMSYFCFVFYNGDVFYLLTNQPNAAALAKIEHQTSDRF